MGWNQTKMGIDRDYLRRCKEMTPGARLDWLAAALEFARMTMKSAKKESRKEASWEGGREGENV